MKHISLFSGIGGFDIAAEWMGWENIAHCEWNPFGQKILKHYWPNAITYEDITKTDFTIHRGNIDIVTGGFPCQPYSVAGKRKGKEDDRHLWPEMLRAIREIQPSWVVGENVLGLVNWNGGLVFEEVQADLENEGYKILPFILPACGVNAPHRRERVWFVAYKNSNDNGRSRNKREKTTSIREQRNLGTGNNEQLFTNNDKNWNDANSECEGLEGHNERQRCTIDREDKRLQFGTKNKFDASKADCGRQPCEEHGQEKSGQFTEKSIPRNWEKFPTQSPVCSGNDGISSKLDGITFSKWRNESIKAGGNAIVPQVVYQIFKAIEEYENKISNYEHNNIA